MRQKGAGDRRVERLAAEGVDVVLVARTAADLEAVRMKIVGEHNVAVRHYAIDLFDSKNVDRLAAECADIDPTASVSLAPNNDAYGA